MLDTEIKTVQVDLYTNIQGTCTKETCDKKSDKSSFDAAITDIYDIMEEIEENTCRKEICHNIQVEAENLKKDTCTKEKCNNIQGEVDKLEMNTCSMEICSNIQRGVENIDICMEDPWDMSCKEHFSTSNSMPETITSFSECFKYGVHSFIFIILSICYLSSSPSSSSCASKFPSSSSLPSVLTSLCPINTCSAIESCLLDPGS